MSKNALSCLCIGILGVAWFFGGGFWSSSVFAATSIPNPLILAVEEDYPPFLFVSNGVAQGLAYDYAVLLADKLGRDLQLSEPMQLAEMLQAAKDGTITLLADIAKTSERDEYLEFSDPFVETPAIVVMRQDADVLWGRVALGYGTVAVGREYGVVQYLRQEFPKMTLIEVDSDADVLQFVSLGWAEAGVLDVSSLSYVLSTMPLTNIEVVAETGFSYALSFAVPEEYAASIADINHAISSITQEERAEILGAWVTVESFDGKKNSQIYYLLLLGIAILLIIGYIWLKILRKVIKNTQNQLQQSNAQLAEAIAGKDGEIAGLKKGIEQQVTDIGKTKRAILNVLEDIQQDKTALAEITEKFQLATRAAGIGILEMNFSDRVIDLDEVAAELYGLPPVSVQLSFEDWKSHLFPDDQAAIEERVEVVRKSGDLFNETFRIVLPSGGIRYLRGYAQVKKGDSGKSERIVGVNYDITAEKAADQLKSDFISLASHQLRTPLTGMRWATELLLKKQDNFTDEQRNYLDKIYQSEVRMVDLVNGLLNTSRLDSGVLSIEPRPVDVREYLLTLVNDVSLVAEKGEILFETNFPQHPVIFSADKDILGIIFENIISNSLKYTLKGGKITVGLHENDGGISVEVIDTGVGIPKAELPKIFQKFFRAANAKTMPVEGTGLGLYSTKSMVELSGGTIVLESEEGRGTRIQVSYPSTGMKKKSGTKRLEKIRLY